MKLKKLLNNFFKKSPPPNISRTEILNYLIKKNNYSNYLEIGVHNPILNFDKVKLINKDGVDPNWIKDPEIGNKFELKSDIFFKSINKEKKYDLIFIDGLHVFEQAYRDIKNSINHLSKNGTIVIHDCNPPTKWHQRPLKEYDGTGAWNGTTWKAFVKFKCTNSNIIMFTIDTDYGLGIIQHGKQKKYLSADVNLCESWDYFNKNKKELLNLLSVNEFFRRY